MKRRGIIPQDRPRQYRSSRLDIPQARLKPALADRLRKLFKREGTK